MRAAGNGAEAVLANFGMIPKAHQPPGKRYMTVNARSETVGEKPAYRAAWRVGQRCLIPAAWIYEPNWETGKHVKYRIGLAGWRPFCVAGVWRTWKEAGGTESIAMAMLTVNADGHPIMQRPDDEKRSVVMLQHVDYEAWLATSEVEDARSLLQQWSVDGTSAEPAVNRQ